jgi:hypothetical protein
MYLTKPLRHHEIMCFRDDVSFKLFKMLGNYVYNFIGIKLMVCVGGDRGWLAQETCWHLTHRSIVRRSRSQIRVN